MKNIYALLSIMGLFVFTNAQIHRCGYQPTQADVDYIVNHISNLAIPKNGGMTCVPIQAHVVRQTNQSGGISSQDMNLGLSYLNDYYYEAGIEFFFCGNSPNYVDNSTYYDFQSSEENALAAAAGENPNAINMYFVDAIDYNPSSGGVTAGYAYPPSSFSQSLRIVLRNDAVASGLSIVHEMGHHFSLLHTFTDPNGSPTTELVNGTNCSSTGDLICDTPADPGFDGTNINFMSCTYSGTATDANGDTYAPDIENAMSYFPEQCMDPFNLTPQQIARIQQGLTSRQNPSNFYDYSCTPANVIDPSNLTATVNGSNFDIAWTDNSNNETGFILEISTTSATAGFRAYGGLAVGENGTAISVSGGQPATMYYFRVKATNDNCNSYSNVDSASLTPPCNITDIQSLSQSGCFAGSNTYTQSVIVTYSNAPSTGNLIVNGQSFAITSSPQSVTLTALNADGNWVNVTASFSAQTSCTYTENNVFQAPPACGAVCSIDSIMAGTQSACDASNNYTQQVTLYYTNPLSGTINVNGQIFPVSGNPQTVTLTNLSGNGNAVDVTAFFSSNNGCSLTETALFTAPNCSGTCSAGDIDPSIAGTAIDYCPNTSISFSSDGNETIPTGGGYGFAFMSATDTLAVTMGASYSGDLNADLAANSITPLATGTYTVVGYTTDNTAAICDVTGTAFTLNVLASSDPACSGTACDAGDVLSTLDGQTFDYCPGTNVDLITDGTETIPSGEVYAWVFINATDTAIIMAGPNYSGDINAFLVANSEPPIPYGTYLVYGVVSSGGQTLICDETPGDFYINVLQSSDPACAPPCSIDAITVGTQSACNPATNTYTQEITITYSNAPTGTINVNGQTFTVTSTPQTITLTNLSANGSAVSINAFFTNNTSCSFTQSNAFTAPAACNATSCIITAISAGTQTACDPATNTYTQQVTVTYNNAPTGTLNVNGQTFAVTSSPQTVTLTNLTANGTAVNVTAFFTNNTSCTFTQNNTFTAPANCTPPPTCSAGDINTTIAGTAIDYCPNTSISFSSDGNEVIPTGGGYGFAFMSATDTVAVTMGTSYSGDLNADLAANSIPPLAAGTYTVIGYTTDGTAICDITATSFTLNVLTASDPACSGTACDAGDVVSTLNGQTFNYCPGTDVDLITDGTETIPSGEVYAWVFINATDTAIIPVGANYSGDINALLAANSLPTIPYGTYTVFGIVTTGGQSAICDETPGDFIINVLQSSDPACQSPCAITAVTAGTQTACDPATNTYTQQVTVTYSNAPTGTLNVNGQTFAVTSSPQTVTLTNLTADGNAVNVTAFFSNAANCNFNSTALFTAPAACAVVPCAISNVSVGNQSACDTSTNTYTQTVTLTYSNAPAGTINVNGQVFNQTSSPQTVTLTGLTADGNAVSINAFFTNDATCSYTSSNAFVAPVNCSGGGVVLDTLVVMMIPNGSGTIYVENDIITSTPYTGYYVPNSIININVTTFTNNTFDFWRLNNLSLIDYSPSTQFAFINQDTLFAYFNGAMSIQALDDAFSSFKAYPTFVNNEITFEFETNKNVPLSIDLYSIDGKKLTTFFNEEVQANTVYKKNCSVDVAGGMYFLKIATDKHSISQKIIKY